MGVQKRIPWLCSLGLGLMALTLWGTRAGADTSSDRPGSIVIWPKVIADGTRDTIITLTNTSNMEVDAHCWYTQGTGVCSLTNDFCSLTSSNSCPNVPGGSNVCVISCETRDFDVHLTHQQPTMWRVSTGRTQDLFLGSGTACTTSSPQTCPGLFQGNSATLPGAVPPAPFQADSPAEFGGFRGELRCVEMTPDGTTPFAGDALKGEAIIEGVTPIPASTDGALLSEYNSINVLAAGSNENGDVLDLNGFAGYNACPNAIDTIHYAPGATDISASSIGADCDGGTCGVQTDFTFVPCRRDFEQVIPTGFIVDFEARDEFESDFSREIRFECWADGNLSQLGFSNINGATFFRTRATSKASQGVCVAGSDILTCAQDSSIDCSPENAPTVCPAGSTCINTACSVDSDCGTGGVCAPASGILSVVEEFHSTSRSVGSPSLVGSAAANTHSVDAADFQPPMNPGNNQLERIGHCRGNLNQECLSNGDCGSGKCRNSGTACTSNAQCTGSGDFCDLCMNDQITLEAGFQSGN